MRPVKHFRELDVYQGAMSLVLKIFELTKHFPIEERCALTNQIRRSSRSVCANLAEAKHGEGGATKLPLFQGSMTRRLKPPRPKPISRLLFDIIVLVNGYSRNWMTPATKFWLKSLKY